MQAVTGVDMAIAMAQLGGIGILPVSQTIEAQCTKVEAVKRFKAGFQTQIITLSPEQSIADIIAIMAETGYSTFPVTDTGVFHGKLLGVITDKDFDVRYDRICQVAERMKTDVQVGVAIDDLKVANQLMITYGRGFLPIVSAEGTLLSVVFKKDLDKHIQHPHATIDAHKRLCVGAAVSTHPEDRERVQALLEHDVDVLVIDASDGHTAFQHDKEYWMEGSLRARNHRRYAQLPELFFEEGVVGYVPHAGSIYDKLPVIVQMVRAALATAGCSSIDALHTHAVLERQSPVALQDSQIHDMVPVHNV